MLIEDGDKRPVAAVLVKVLVHSKENRGMRLEEFASRCVRRGEVHELVTTDHDEADASIDRVGFLGFAEISHGGVIDRGDEVRIGEQVVGTVLGFDACHFPNHYNILIRREAPVTGAQISLAPESAVRFGRRADR